jgi:alpha-D-xyloside xylohydrolase
MVWQHDYTILRGLVMDFEGDTAVNAIADEYMLGPSLLIAPVTEYQARSREVYLPAGQGWYDLYSGKYFKGGQHLTAEAPYERMPVFVKEGSVIPFGKALQYTGEKPADTITLFVYTGKNAHFTLYEDEGANYNYEKGAFANIPFDYDEASQTFTIGSREGAFSGMLKERIFRIVWSSKTRPAALGFDGPVDATVRYRGEQVSVRLR